MKINGQVQAVIFDMVLDRLKILLVKKLDVKNYSLRWRLLKGSIEENEDEQHAMSREIFEEVGLSKIKIDKKINEYKFEYQGTVNNVQTFAVSADSKQALKIQTSEIADARWVGFEDAKKLLFWPNEKEALENFAKYYL